MLVACDVGQGDALVVRAGRGSGVVVDAGPDPAAVDGCLDRLEIERVPLLVLTHFHADHVDGLAGVLDGRAVGAVEVSPVADPPEGAAEVECARARGRAGAGGGAVRREPGGSATSRCRCCGRCPARHATGPGDGSTANDASVVLLVEVAGVRLLLTGDVEPEAQAALARAWPGLRVDVLKVPHHGSRYQDLDFLGGPRRPAGAGQRGRGQRLRPPGAGDPGRAGRRPGPRCCAPTCDGDLAVVVRDGAAARPVTSEAGRLLSAASSRAIDVVDVEGPLLVRAGSRERPSIAAAGVTRTASRRTRARPPSSSFLAEDSSTGQPVLDGGDPG